MIEQRIKDRLRELLFPLTIIAIVGSVYAMAMARSGEAKVAASSTRAHEPEPQVASIDTNE